MLHYFKQGKIELETIVRKMSHAVADCFQVKDRGYIREGYYGDLVIVDLNEATVVEKQNIMYRCGWSPFEGFRFPARVTHTFVSGHLAYQNGEFNESQKGKRLQFDR
jgi:dihydroorotase